MEGGVFAFGFIDTEGSVRTQNIIRWMFSLAMCIGVIVFPWIVAKWIVAISMLLTMITFETFAFIIRKLKK